MGELKPYLGLSYSKALEQSKQGKLIFRKGWNGKNLYVQYHGAIYFNSYNLNPFFTIFRKTPDREIHDTWVPSVSDLMAEDWQVVD